MGEEHPPVHPTRKGFLMATEKERTAALKTRECILYVRASEAFEEASKVLEAARQAYNLASQANKKAETAYHATPEFKVLQAQWGNR